MKIGTVFASTGGNKLARSIRSFHRMEPQLNLHVVFDVGSNSWQQRNHGTTQWVEARHYVKTRYFPANRAHINGTLNEGMRWMAELGFDHVLLLHDDLIFSPLWRHRHALSKWFDKAPVGTGMRFAHLETFVPDTDRRRRSEDWDREDLEGKSLWRFLTKYNKFHDGWELRPPGASFWFKYEGPDKVRKWNRLGPTAQLVPVKSWAEVGGFDEHDGIFYDQHYPSECFKRKMAPVWAVPNFPHIHLHNQSMNPWGDPAPGPWGDSMLAFEKRYGANWAGFWKDDWEEKWHD